MVSYKCQQARDKGRVLAIAGSTDFILGSVHLLFLRPLTVSNREFVMNETEEIFADRHPKPQHNVMFWLYQRGKGSLTGPSTEADRQ